MLKPEYARTLSIVKQLASGKRLTLPSGYIIAMGDDMSIGFLLTKLTTGEEFVGGLSTMDLAQLNNILNEYNIGHAIPEQKENGIRNEFPNKGN